MSTIYWQQQPQETMAVVPTAAKSVTGKKRETAPSNPQPKPFQWSQLDAPDFATFVKNLRDIGCPESTIRDIVTGELKEIYDQKRLQITRVTGTAGADPAFQGNESNRLKSASPAAAPVQRNAQAAISQLQTEQAELLAGLLAPPAPGSAVLNTGGQVDTKSDNGNKTTVNAAAEVPAAFLVGNADGLKANPQELAVTVTDPTLDVGTAQVLNQMRIRFVDAVQTVQQDPASPDYYEQWRKARRDSDEYFSSMYGGDAFIQTQLQANKDASLTGGSSK